MRLRYGGKSLAQIINSCQSKNPEKILKVVKKQSQISDTLLSTNIATEPVRKPPAAKKKKATPKVQ